MSAWTSAVWTGARANGRARQQRGSTLVEQAIILPVLLALFFGVIDMGRALYSYSFVSYVAREATRWASVRSTNLNPGAPIGTGDVDTFVKNAATTGIDPANLSAATIWKAPANGSPACATVQEKPGCVVQVTVTYNFKFVLPFLPTNTLRMTSESQMIITQ